MDLGRPLERALRALPRARSSRAVRPAALAGWAVGAVAFALLYGALLVLLRRAGLDDAARGLAGRSGGWGVALCLGAMAAAVMTPLPDAPVALAALVAYGPLGGLAVAVAGSWLGAMADFAVVRALGRGAFRRRFPRAAGRLDALLGRRALPLLVLLRVVPTVSFDVLSYAAALSRVGAARFAAATLLGLLPGPTVAAVVGAGVGDDRRLTLALALLALGLFAALLLLARHRGSDADDAPDAAPGEGAAPG